MGLDKVKLANKKFKRQQRRKQAVKGRRGELPITEHRRKLRDRRDHHRPQEGRHTRRYKLAQAE